MGRRADRPILDFPLNPHYGHGIARRRIRLVGSPGMVQSVLADIFHEMRCTITHDGDRVTAIHGETIRIPTSACPAAAAMLEELKGMPIDITAADLFAGGRAQRNCTHLFDLAALTLAHARRGSVTRIYEATVPDETDDPVDIEVRRDEVPVHRWRVRDGAIIAPEELAGHPVGRGFTGWAAKRFEGDALEAATVLSRTYFLAYGRGFLPDASDGLPVATQSARIGVCYAYAPERAALATFRAGNGRDFTDGVVETPWHGGPGQ